MKLEEDALVKCIAELDLRINALGYTPITNSMAQLIGRSFLNSETESVYSLLEKILEQMVARQVLVSEGKSANERLVAACTELSQDFGTITVSGGISVKIVDFVRRKVSRMPGDAYDAMHLGTKNHQHKAPAWDSKAFGGTSLVACRMLDQLTKLWWSSL